MTVSDLKTILQNNVDDNVDVTVMLGWLNRGYEYVQQFVIVPDNEGSASISFTAGIADLPTDFLHFVELDIGGTKYTTEIDYEQRNQYTSASHPCAYYFWGKKLGIIPADTAAGILAYVKMAAALALDADTPSLPTIFQPLIAEYAIGLYRAQNGNYAKAAFHYNSVDAQIERLTGKLRRRTRRQLSAWGDIRDLYPDYP